MSLELRGVRDELRTLERHMEDLFQGIGRPRRRRHRPLGPPASGRFVPVAPSSDEFARDGDLVIRVELPGIDPSRDVTVELDDGELVVRGKWEDAQAVKEEDYYCKEFWYGASERRLPLPEGTSEDAIEAIADKGVLQVTVHGAAKAIEEPAKPERKAIPIKAKQ